MPPTPESLIRGAVAGIIESGTMVRATTAQLWAEVNGAIAELGLARPANIGQIVSELRSESTARRIGYETFQAAGRESEFTRSMAANEANIRPESVRAILPEYLVRFDLTFTAPDGSQQTLTVSMRDTWRPDMTVGDVHDAVAEAAEGLANEYGRGLIGFGNLKPVTI
jgi:hypothetical protein